MILLTLPLNIFIVWYEGRRGRELGSDVLLADATSTRINIFVSLAALVGLLGTAIGLPWLDIVVALGIVAYVAVAAYRIICETRPSVLTDSAVIDPHVVEDIAREVPGVWFATKVRSRGREDDVHLDLHVKVDPAMATEQAHAIASEVERRVKDQMPGVVDAVVHIEPGQDTPASEWETLAVQLRALADGLGLGVHNLHIDVLDGGYIVDVDVEIDSSLSLETSHRIVSRVRVARAGRDSPLGGDRDASGADGAGGSSQADRGGRGRGAARSRSFSWPMRSAARARPITSSCGTVTCPIGSMCRCTAQCRATPRCRKRI